MKFVNSKGVTWYLHSKDTVIGRNKIPVKTYFFKREISEGHCDMPIGYKPSETKNGLPVIKRI